MMKKGRMTWKWLFISLLLVLALMLPKVGACADVVKWKLQGAYPWGDLSQDLLKDFVAKVKELSKGRMEITLYAGDEIVPYTELLPAVGKGVIDMGMSLLSYWRKEYPVTDVDYGLPFTFMGDPDKLYERMHNTEFWPIMQEMAKSANIYYLDWHTYGGTPNMYHSGKKRIMNMDDFKKVKLRATGAYKDIFKNVGAGIAFVPGGEIYSALQLGTIDMVNYDISAMFGLKWHEVVNYIYMPFANDWQGGSMWVNLDKWNSLSKDLQDILKQASKYYFKRTVTEYEKEIVKVLSSGPKNGYEAVFWSDDVWAKIKEQALKYTEEWGKSSERNARMLKVLKEHFMNVKPYWTKEKLAKLGVK